MIVRCQACGVEEDHASPGCLEHARRSAETAHLFAAASGLPCLADCPVCSGRRRMRSARRAGVR